MLLLCCSILLLQKYDCLFIFDDVPPPKCLRDGEDCPLLDLSLDWFDYECCDLLGTNAYALDASSGIEISEGSLRRKSKFGLPSRTRSPAGANVKVVHLAKMHSSPDMRGTIEEMGEDSKAAKIEKFRKTTPKTTREKSVTVSEPSVLPRSSSSAKVEKKRDLKDSAPESEEYSPEITKQDLRVINENLRKSKVASMLGSSDVLAVTAETQMQQSAKLQALLGAQEVLVH